MREEQALIHYEFGPFRLSSSDRQLYVGERLVAITPKVFHTLLILVEHSGHLVTKGSLLHELWPDSFVEEGSLSQNISLLRKALADEDACEYIETIPKRGYRFVADVRRIYEEPRPLSQQNHEHERSSAVVERERSKWKQRVMWAACSIILVAGLAYPILKWYRVTKSTEINSIAVLPFKAVGNDDDHLGLGIANTIIVRLAENQARGVLPTSTIRRYSDSTRDVFAIGRNLGVDAVLDGTVQRLGNRVLVTAELIRVRDGASLWAGKFDEELGNIFAVQDAITQKLTNKLLPNLAPLAGDSGHRFTKNVNAYQAFSTGLYLYSKGGADVIRSIAHFEEATIADPQFARAYAYLADAYYFNAATNGSWAKALKLLPTSSEESVRRAKLYSDLTMSIDPHIPEVHLAIAGLKTLEDDYDAAETEYRRALELNPGFASAYMRHGIFLYHMGNLDDTVAELRRGQLLDPVSPITNIGLANMLLQARQYDESIHYATRALELSPGDNSVRMMLGEAYYFQGRYDEALKWFVEALNDPAGGFITSVKSDLATLYAATGQRTKAEQLLAELEAAEDKKKPSYYLVSIYVALGQNNKAVEILKRQNNTRYFMAQIKYDPFLDGLRSDPEFNRLIGRPAPKQYH